MIPVDKFIPVNGSVGDNTVYFITFLLKGHGWKGKFGLFNAGRYILWK